MIQGIVKAFVGGATLPYSHHDVLFVTILVCMSISFGATTSTCERVYGSGIVASVLAAACELRQSARPSSLRATNNNRMLEDRLIQFL